MSTASYVLNFDELVEALVSYFKDGIKVDIGNIAVDNSTIEKLLSQISSKIDGVDYKDLIGALNTLTNQLQTVGTQNGISGIQRIYGQMLEVPALEKECILNFTVPKKAVITGITYSQSSWNYNDSWNLKIGDNILFNNVYTKEFGEHKYFNKFYGVEAGDNIQFIFNNSSGSSKVVWIDFEIIEVS